MRSKILFFALGVAACGPALAAQQPAPVMTALSAMPTSDVSRFSHDFHVNKVGFNCVDCHTSLFQQAGGSAKAVGDFNMTSFEKGKYCGTCHDGNTAFATEKDNCARCHGSSMKPSKNSSK